MTIPNTEIMLISMSFTGFHCQGHKECVCNEQRHHEKVTILKFGVVNKTNSVQVHPVSDILVFGTINK
jgi:hypothetical protein